MILSSESSRFSATVVIGRREGVGDGENERKRRRGKETEISWFIFRNNSVDESMSLRQGEACQLDAVLTE